MASLMRYAVLGICLLAIWPAQAQGQRLMPGRPNPRGTRPQVMTSEQFRVYVAVRRVSAVKESPISLVEFLDDDEPHVRRVAIDYLVAHGDEAIDPLLEAAGGPNARVRSMAIWTLRRIGPKGIPALFPLLMTVRNDLDYQVRLNANALFAFTDDRAVRPLIEALDDPQPLVRAAAADSLGYFRSEEAVPFLSDRLQDPSAEVRRSAVSAIGRVSPWAVEFCQTELLKALADRDSQVRSRAGNALGNVTNAGLPKLFDGLEDPQESVRSGCAMALVATGARSVPQLVEKLKHQDPQVRFWAAYALGRIGRPAEPALPLLQALATEDADSSVRFYAHTAVGLIRR